MKAGLKADRRDLALIVSDVPAAAAGVFTVNRLCAAPVRHAAALLPSGALRAIVANSGNANAMTGPAGAGDERAMAAAIATGLGISAVDVLTASTGSIGPRLPVDKIAAATPALVDALAADEAAFTAAAEAIRTTDLTTKIATREIVIGGRSATIAAMAKGSGMIHPQMATMLCFIATDAAVSPAALQAALQEAVDESFNTITVDGDMSTNDSVIALANGRAGTPVIEGPGAGFDLLRDTLGDLCGALARRIAADGEGATKLLIVDVAGAPDRDMARELARAVAGSSLVKSGVFGGDPSWGRILAALGARVGARAFTVDLSGVSLAIQGTSVYDGGGPVAFDRPALNARMKDAEIAVRLDLGAGPAAARALGCDLSYEYVRINADYAGAIAAGPGAGVATGAPTAGAGSGAIASGGGGMARHVVVEALSYIRKFAGRRAVIKYGGAAMVDPALKRSFAEEVVLLQAAGLRPIVVHGGGHEITRTLERLGHKTEFADGQRITSADDVRVVEMVLTGKINTEIIGLLNSLGGTAVGLSGKDARLLSARKLQPKPGKPDLGFVGEIEAVNPEILEMLLERNFIPVISPVGLGADGASYNINADVAAAEIAVAARATKLLFLTDVAGVLDAGGKLISEIRAGDLETRLASASESGIKGGMMVKTQAVLRALRGGVQAVHIVDGRVPHSIVAELFTDKGVGTLVTV
ncbi:MAG: bifunctional glutamate N-acetyltransferase/amino-acid acetyltransferase ArgJ [Pseudomonadota bacterium]